MSDLITLEGGEVLDLSEYPLPDDVADTLMNKAELAKAMNVALPTLDKWITQRMPVHDRGGNGRSYAFQLSHCYAWRMNRAEGEAAKRARNNEIADQLAMHFLGIADDDDKEPMMSARDMRDWAETEIKRNQAAEQRGDLVRTRAVERLLEDLLVAVRRGITGLPDWVEQEFSLSPTQVEKAQNYCDGLLDEMRNQIERTGFGSGQVVEIEGAAEPQKGAS